MSLSSHLDRVNLIYPKWNKASDLPDFTNTTIKSDVSCIIYIFYAMYACAHGGFSWLQKTLMFMIS